MAGKDSNDMTASEMLRLAAGEGEQGGWTGTVRKLAYLVGISDLRICELNNCDLLDESYKVIADKIDAELAQVRADELRDLASICAVTNGWPGFREGEVFVAWLDRCFIPRPRFEDGEPVHIGDKAEHPYTGETCTIDCINTFDGSYCLGFVEGSSASLLDRERVKRPAPEALGADGKPIKVGETVWLADEYSRYADSTGSENGNEYSLFGVDSQEALMVEYDRLVVNGKNYVRLSTCNAWCTASWLTHTQPDTQERIDEDAEKFHCVYFGGYGACGTCPASAGELSKKSCKQQQILDLLRRQRLLDGVAK